jgi:enterochelin esterase family protein
MDVKDFVELGLSQSLWDLDHDPVVNGRSNQEIQAALQAQGDERYRPCPEAIPRMDVPTGRQRSLKCWGDSAIYPRTTRDITIHVPAGVEDVTTSPGIVIFQDGHAYLNPQGTVRAATVLDNLVADGKLPPVIGVFVDPGRPNAGEKAQRDPLAHMRQRSIEYDSCNDRYARFLTAELLPLVEADLGRSLSDDPGRRALCGISSGGLAAFNAAWHAPESFGCVLSHCGSFTNIRGGHNYPYLVRTSERKPLRIVLQSGRQDADILYGSWPLANQTMAAALSFAGYQHRFLYGAGGHSLRHGGEEMANSLRWLLQPAAPAVIGGGPG